MPGGRIGSVPEEGGGGDVDGKLVGSKKGRRAEHASHVEVEEEDEKRYSVDAHMSKRQ